MFRIITSLFLFFALATTGFSQSDTTSNDSSPLIIEDCETMAIESQKQLIKTDFYEPDQLLENLEIWSAGCGEVEPIQRMRILIKINQKQLEESDYRKYITNQIEKFKDRVVTSGESDYQKVYESHEGYFSYVPLNGTFDAKTKEIAKQLLVQQEEGTAAYTFALLFSEDIDKFESEISSEDNALHDAYMDSQPDNNEDEVYEGDEWVGAKLGLELGRWMPDKKLSKFFSPSPYLGLKGGGSFNDNWSVDVNLLLIILVQDENYRITTVDSIQTTDSDVIFSITTALVRTQHLGKNWFLDGSAGIGVNGMNTDIRHPVAEDEEVDEDNEYHTLFTFDFNIGFMIRKELKNSHSIGINCTYHYAPYGLDKRLVDVFGDQSLRLGIGFIF